ncbi:hypothetical protein ACFPYJ_05455 [Paenibacillus solisilvae]|uniref:Uncharacterized protein n=1 Tax=Paenibacillus solisilvae TaxID=2486751 RepID=A0ABW0VWM1_9BACL
MSKTRHLLSDYRDIPDMLERMKEDLILSIRKNGKIINQINRFSEFLEIQLIVDMAKETHVAQATNFRGIVSLNL